MAIVIDLPGVPAAGSRQRTKVRAARNGGFLSTVLGLRKFHYLSRTDVYVARVKGSPGEDTPSSFDVKTASLGMQAIHQCFATHTPLSLTPDFLWHCIVYEVAEYIRQNPDKCARLFVNVPGGKQAIRVRNDNLVYDASSDWGQALGLFERWLRRQLSESAAGLLLAEFSTTTAEDKIAQLMVLTEAASPYYDYIARTMCGIPQIRLEGTAFDWQSLYLKVQRLTGEFDGLSGYFNDLIPVLDQLADAATGQTPHKAFWQSIYKYQNESGGAMVSGWITAFFAYVQTPLGPVLKETFDWQRQATSQSGCMLNQFPSHISRMPFVWECFDKTYNVVFASGVMGVDYVDEFLTPRLGWAVAEM